MLRRLMVDHLRPVAVFFWGGMLLAAATLISQLPQ